MAVMKKGMAAALVTAESTVPSAALCAGCHFESVYFFKSTAFSDQKNDRFAESRRPFRNCWNACSGSSF